MRVLCVFVLASILFEGFIIQCNGGDNPMQPRLPNPLISDILFRAGFETTRNAANAKILSEEAITQIFKESVIIIEAPHYAYKEISEFEKKDKRYLKIKNYDKLMKLFEHFGEYVRKIHVDYSNIQDDMRRYINEKIIKKCAEKLTELKICAGWNVLQNNRNWQEISNEKGDILFPNVKKFSFEGQITKNPFNMSSIFPKLEIFKLKGGVDDINCLPNIRQMKKLTLATDSVGEDELVNIIANNQKLTKLNIWNNDQRKFGIKTVQSIANNLKDLKTLTVEYFGKEFFVPTTNKVYNFTSVTTFNVLEAVENLYENVSFDMPNLENLKLVTYQRDITKKISTFINRFAKLETVYVMGLTEETYMRCAESLIHVKEFTAQNFENSKLSSLKTFFKNFDKKKSNLRRLKLFSFDHSNYPKYEATMNEINNELKGSKKPTWKISKRYYDQPGKYMGYYLVFKRDT